MTRRTDAPDLGSVDPQEAAWLAEDVDLQPWERRRIIAALRTLRRGNARELLGVADNATQRELKRAYFELSKEFHPDRYFGRRLGSYGALLTRVFESLSRAVKTLSDPRTVTSPTRGPGGPRRRRTERFPFAVRVSVTSVMIGFPSASSTRPLTEPVPTKDTSARTASPSSPTSPSTRPPSLPPCSSAVTVNAPSCTLGKTYAP